VTRRGVGQLVALEQNPLEALKIPKLVKVREVFAAPAAQVEEHLAPSFLVQIQWLKLTQRETKASVSGQAAAVTWR
jgi:hypothetical protein